MLGVRKFFADLRPNRARSGDLVGLPVPVAELRERLAEFRPGKVGLATEFAHRALGFGQVAEMFRLDFRQQHPALEIILAPFELADDFHFRRGRFAPLQLFERALIHWRQASGCAQGQQIAQHRQQQHH